MQTWNKILNVSAMKKIILISVVGLVFLMGCVSKSDVNSLDTRLNELEIRNAEAKKSSKALQTGLQSREEQEQELRHQSASLRAKMNALDEEIRILSGRIDELEHLIQRQNQKDARGSKAEDDTFKRLAETAKANDERIFRLEQYLNMETSANAAPEEKKEPVAKLVPAEKAKAEPTEDEIYQMAKQAFDQGDSDAARAKFQELIERFPKSERADNAQFWIGEIYYREKWYEKSILEYQKVIENYPKGNKVPASLLKQGFAFSNLGDDANSRLILQELIKKYPESNEAKIAKDKLKGLK
jgi:tol-pal system protein YbgF